MSWLLSVPVWGEPYTTNWIKQGLPSIRAAIAYADDDEVAWHIHTDDQERIAKVLGEATYNLRPVPEAPNTTCALGNCHRSAISFAVPTEKVAFIHADMIISREFFRECEKRLASAKFVCGPAIRCKEGDYYSAGMPADALFNVAWSNRHPFTDACVWSRGNCKLPPYVIFHSDWDVVMHAFDLQPYALRKEANTEYHGPTGSEIICMFKFSEISVIDHGQAVIAEPCAPSLPYSKFNKKVFNDRTVLNWGRHFDTQVQQDLFRRQVVLRGKASNAAQVKANLWSDAIQADLKRGLIPNPVDVLSSKIRLALMLPYSVRQLFPKSFRQWILNLDWWQ